MTVLKRQNAERLRQIDRHIKAIEAEIEAKLKADPTLARKCDILTSIPGVSKITAFAFIIEMPELGTLDGKQAASMIGARGPAVRAMDKGSFAALP